MIDQKIWILERKITVIKVSYDDGFCIKHMNYRTSPPFLNPGHMTIAPSSTISFRHNLNSLKFPKIQMTLEIFRWCMSTNYPRSSCSHMSWPGNLF